MSKHSPVKFLNFCKALLHFGEKKTFVFIHSTMRSGSTLLKALLANAPDTSYLPEINTNKYSENNSWTLKLLSPAKILILKKPAWFPEHDYPRFLHIKNAKQIFLVRDVYDTVISLQAMNKQISQELDAEWTYEKLVHDYWLRVNDMIINHPKLREPNSTLIKYEDLVKCPIETTKSLFQFIGSAVTEGVDSYHRPQTFDWQWGNDDGGEKIKSLRVEYTSLPKDNDELIQIIQSSEKVQALRKQLGYID